DMLSLAGVEGVPDGMGMDPGAVFTATAIAAAVGTLMMGIVARYPIVLAPGMGLNASFAYTVILTYEIPWETAISGALASGILSYPLVFVALCGLIVSVVLLSDGIKGGIFYSVILT